MSCGVKKGSCSHAPEQHSPYLPTRTISPKKRGAEAPLSFCYLMVSLVHNRTKKLTDVRRVIEALVMLQVGIAHTIDEIQYDCSDEEIYKEHQNIVRNRRDQIQA